MVIGVIPARFASTRFPGKLLADLNGKPVLQWTWEAALKAKLLDRVVIAAADGKIFNAAKRFGGEVVKVFEELPSGSDRVWRAYCRLQIADCRLRSESTINNQQSTIIVNIQGDEPMLDPKTVDAVVRRLQNDPEAGVATAVALIRSKRDYEDPSVVKVVMTAGCRVLYFSRSPIPHGWTPKSRIQNPKSPTAFRHIGIYAYRCEALERFVNLPPSSLEVAEKLEQLRLLQAGTIYTAAVVKSAGVAVDTEEDLGRVRQIIRGLPA